MRVILVDGMKIGDMTDIHSLFSSALSFGGNYGGNLDALYDLLSESAEEIGVITVNTDELKKKTGKRYNAFIRLLKDVERENESFYFCPDPFGTDKI